MRKYSCVYGSICACLSPVYAELPVVSILSRLNNIKFSEIGLFIDNCSSVSRGTGGYVHCQRFVDPECYFHKFVVVKPNVHNDHL
jgi:hypothetical protein